MTGASVAPAAEPCHDEVCSLRLSNPVFTRGQAMALR